MIWLLSFGLTLLITAATCWAMIAIDNKLQRDLKRDREEDARLIAEIEKNLTD